MSFPYLSCISLHTVNRCASFWLTCILFITVFAIMYNALCKQCAANPKLKQQTTPCTSLAKPNHIMSGPHHFLLFPGFLLSLVATHIPVLVLEFYWSNLDTHNINQTRHFQLIANTYKMTWPTTLSHKLRALNHKEKLLKKRFMTNSKIFNSG